MVKVSNMDIPLQAGDTPPVDLKQSDVTTSGGFSCRDPFILLYGGKYYLYRSMFENGIACFTSDDLEHWSKPHTVYSVPKNFHGVKDFFWAPECHYYKGYFYIFTSVYSEKYNHRVISVYRSNNPLGPFEDIADGCITPKDWDAIDGTLYIDEDGSPWLVFVHEWTSMPNGNGGMVAARLSEDFSRLKSEPILLFRARDPKWARLGVTDGPYVFRLSDGKLGMIWSNFCKDDYCVAVAFSDNGKITGKWVQREELLYARDLKPEFLFDGGHAMLFYDKDGKLRMALHSPNDRAKKTESLVLFEVKERDGILCIQ